MDYLSLADDLLTFMAFRKLPADHSSHSSGERGILLYLHNIRDGVLSGDLSRDLGITTGRTAIALKNLEKKGLVSRSISETDRRCVVVHITEQGHAAAQEFRRHALETLAATLSRLGEEDARTYVRLIKKILGSNTEYMPLSESDTD